MLFHLCVILGLLGLSALVVIVAQVIVHSIVHSNMLKPERSIFTHIPTKHTQIFIPSNTGMLDIITTRHPSSKTTVMYLHGNSGRIPATIADLAVTHSVVSVAYPGFHKSQGIPSQANVIATAQKTFEYLTVKQNIQPKNIIIYGHSMGGHPAIVTAKNHPDIQKLVLVNTFASAASMAGKRYGAFVGWLVQNSTWNSTHPASHVTCPVQQFHAATDMIISLDEGKKLAQAFNPKIHTFTVMQDATHIVYDTQQTVYGNP